MEPVLSMSTASAGAMGEYETQIHTLSSQQLRESLRRNMMELDSIQLRLRGLHDTPAPCQQDHSNSAEALIFKDERDGGDTPRAGSIESCCDASSLLRAGTNLNHGGKVDCEASNSAGESVEQDEMLSTSLRLDAWELAMKPEDQASVLAVDVVSGMALEGKSTITGMHQSSIMAAVQELSSLFEPHSASRYDST